MEGPAEGASQKWSGSWNEMLVVPFSKGTQEEGQTQSSICFGVGLIELEVPKQIGCPHNLLAPSGLAKTGPCQL